METPSSPNSTAAEAALPSRAVWALLLLLLLAVGPLFVCLPLNSDTALFDLQARVATSGGVLYRDILEPNLPGIVWVHLAIRSLVGWSSEAMRCMDLLIVTATLVIAGRLIAAAKASSPPPVFFLAAGLFYLSTNEWCHCQRDPWMLLPALAAVWLRTRRHPGCGFRLTAVTEGVCWGVAFWIKPHVAIPALAVILTDLLQARPRRNAVAEAAAVVCGGLLAAVPGVLWLLTTGAWIHFQDMLLNWNPEYLAAGAARKNLDRWLFMAERFRPWWLLHLAAVPAAVRILTVRKSAADAVQRPSGLRVQRLLAALYLGWLGQSVLLQHAMDYIHVPGLLLALMIVAVQSWSLPVFYRRAAVLGLLVLAAWVSPMLQLQRLQCWQRCWQQGSTANVRATLAHGNFPDWEHLAHVAAFLKTQDLQNRQLTCANVHSVHLYNELAVWPATRYWSPTILRELFPLRASQIELALNNSSQRFVVVESREQQRLSTDLRQPAGTDGPVVFQSGSYRVYAVPKHTAGEKSAVTATVMRSVGEPR